jgi:hypothetical protein
MSNVIIPYRFVVKRDTAAAFTAANTMLLSGEIGLETDTRRYKIGDGATAWNSLAYSSAATLADARRILDLLGSTAEGDMIRKGASGWERLPKGADGQIIKQVSGLPAWANESGGGGGGGGAFAFSETANAYSTTNTTIPADNTIPQSSEGDALPDLDTVITPTSGGSVLSVSLHIPWLVSSGNGIGVRIVIFRDSGADALYATSVTPNTSQVDFHARFSIPSGSTSPTTFKVRWGVSSGTGYINRNAGTAAFFGGAMKASLSVQEH